MIVSRDLSKYKKNFQMSTDNIYINNNFEINLSYTGTQSDFNAEITDMLKKLCIN